MGGFLAFRLKSFHLSCWDMATMLFAFRMRIETESQTANIVTEWTSGGWTTLLSIPSAKCSGNHSQTNELITLNIWLGYRKTTSTLNPCPTPPKRLIWDNYSNSDINIVEGIFHHFQLIKYQPQLQPHPQPRGRISLWIKFPQNIKPQEKHTHHYKQLWFWVLNFFSFRNQDSIHPSPVSG